MRVDNTVRAGSAGDRANEAWGFGASDLTTAAPLCAAAEFSEMVGEMVIAETPRLFAVV